MARIAIDATAFDTISRGSGQYRYMVDLVRGLCELNTRDEYFVVGSGGSAPEELESVFNGSTSFTFVSRAQSQRRGSFFVEQMRWAYWLRRTKIELLHALHTFIPLLTAIPIVATKYDLMIELFPEYEPGRSSRTYRWHRWSARNRVRTLIAISHATAGDLEAVWNVERTSIAVIPLGVGDVRTGGLVRENDSARPLLVSPYNLEPRKNLAALLKAVHVVRRAIPHVQLQLYGNAAVAIDRERAFLGLAQALGLDDCIVRTGILSTDELAALYERATVFVFPSLYEGFGLPILEAMRSGCCVVARGTSSMAEVLGDTGLLTETTDSERLAETILLALRDPSLRTRLGERARARSLQYTVKRMARETYDVYLDALRGSRR